MGFWEKRALVEDLTSKFINGEDFVWTRDEMDPDNKGNNTTDLIRTEINLP